VAARSKQLGSRGERRRQETRAKLIRAAHELMGEKGIGATTIQEITDTADVGFGSFYNHFESKQAIVQAADQALHVERLDGRTLADWLAGGTELAQLIGRTGALDTMWRRDPEAVRTAAVDCRYAGYVERQRRSAARLAEMEAKAVPASLDYGDVPHLRAEARQRLSAVRPETLGQALRVSGITPADVTVVMIHLNGRNRR